MGCCCWSGAEAYGEKGKLEKRPSHGTGTALLSVGKDRSDRVTSRGRATAQRAMRDAGSMGSATDGDEDAVTGLIYLAELIDSDEARTFAVKSIAAFVLEDLGLGARDRSAMHIRGRSEARGSISTQAHTHTWLCIYTRMSRISRAC